LEWQGLRRFPPSFESRRVGAEGVACKCADELCDSNLAKPERPIPDSEWMQEHTHLARLFGRAVIPLTLLTERTGAATVNTGSIHDTQASIGFSALLMRGQFLVGWAAKRSIRLESKILGSEATGLPCRTHFWRSGVWWRWRESRGKLGRAQGLWLELMAQFESQVPGPLRDHLPGFLPQAAWLHHLSGSCSLSSSESTGAYGATMQIQFNDIADREGVLGQIREEQLVDHAFSCDANRTLLFRSLMRGHNDAIELAIGPDRDLWTVVEAAHHLTFGSLLHLIGGQVQACLNERMVEQAIVFPAGDKREASHIGEDRSIAILPIEPHQRAFW
jgi:hypothetical protein